MRYVAVQTLGMLEAGVLATHAGAIVATLEDENRDVRRAAVATLGKLEAGVLDALRSSPKERERLKALGLLTL